jgi:hypothetical protein
MFGRTDTPLNLDRLDFIGASCVQQTVWWFVMHLTPETIILGTFIFLDLSEIILPINSGDIHAKTSGIHRAIPL